MNNNELFLAYIQAYNAKDVDKMLSLFDDECVFENLSGGKITVRTQGKTELETLARKSEAAFASREQKILNLISAPGGLAAEIEYHGILQTDLTPELKAGTHLDLRGVSVVEFSGGKIMRLSDYS